MWRSLRSRPRRPGRSAVAAAVGVKSPRPSDLRGSFVSLLIQEGRTVIDVAAQAGHTPETCLRHYARLFRDAPADRMSAELAIRRARDELRDTAGSGEHAKELASKARSS